MPDGAYARSTDPITSSQAADSLAGQITVLEGVVLAAIRDAGARGCNLDEVIDVTSLDKVTASPRFRPLCNKNLVREQGKRPGKSGRAQTVWVAVSQTASA